MRFGIFSLFFLFLLSFNSGWADSSSKFLFEKQNALLWSLEKDGQPTSYLMGTMHIGHEKLAPVVNLAKQSLINVETLCLELIMDSQVQQRLSQRMLYAGDVREILGSKRVRLIQDSFKDTPMAQHWHRFKPWVLVMLTMMPEDTGQGVDQLLQNQAKQDDKNLCALETVDEQVDIFDNLSLDDQLQMLDETLKMLPEIPAMLKQVTDAYIQQDLELLWETNKQMMLMGDEAFNRSLMARFLDDRNIIMAERAQLTLQKGSVMVAVGALHLPGPNGLIQLFRQQGYKVNPVLAFKN